MPFRVLTLVVQLILAPLSAAQAADLSGDYDHQRFADRDPSIDPDDAIYGVPFGSTVDEVKAAFGAPRGIVLINRAKQALLYGRSHLFVFVRGKLREMVVDANTVHWLVANEIEVHPFFDGDKWALKPGLHNRMSFADVQAALEMPHASPSYELQFDGVRSNTTLRFAARRGLLGGESYFLLGFAITNYGG